MEDTNIEKIIDVSKIKTSKELQKKLMEELEFPYFYGKNWNAFWDAITGLVEMPEKIIIRGWENLVATLPDDAAIMKESFEELNEEYPMIKCNVEYQ